MVDDNNWVRSTRRYLRNQGAAWAAAVAFYTCLPVPISWTLEFRGIARFAPALGLGIGALLGLADAGLEFLKMPVLTRSALVIVAGIGITGGLHLDGAMDAADGLAVPDRDRRLEVMADSVTGAFGAMAAVSLLLLKTAALSDLNDYRWLALMGVAGWGRWGQLVAIARGIILQPKILLLDEPTSALDAGTAARLLQVLTQLAANNQTTILMVNHQLELAEQFCTQVLHLQGGKLLADSPAHQIDWQQLRQNIIAAQVAAEQEW